MRSSCNSWVLALAVLACALAGSAARADIWVLDKQASVVRFTYDHLGLSRQGGRFTEIDGRLELSPTDPESGSVDITIRATSISTGTRA